MPDKTKLSRHESRELAYKLIFAFDFNREENPEDLYNTYIEESGELSSEISHELFVGTAGNIEKIDIIIDDSVDEINKALELGINAILVTSPLNVNRKCSAKRFNNWSLIYKYIEQKYGN